MNLGAGPLSTWQICKRRYALETQHAPIRWRPKVLLESILRPAILAISNGADVMITSKESCTQLMEKCAREGLDTLKDPYTLARDFCSIIETVLHSLSRLPLLCVKPGGVLQLGDTEHCWRLSSFVDESGMLHRWALVDKLDDDAKYRELQSWFCFGDCAAAGVGMTLHLIEIGRQSRGHQVTDWCRAYKHPAIHNHFRFRKTDGSALEKSWIPVWYQDSDKNTPQAWVDLMESDGVSLMHHIDIAQPRPEHIEEFYNEVQYEAEGMMEIGTWNQMPRSRPACNLPYVCPWQEACYAPPGVVNVDSIGGYRRV